MERCHQILPPHLPLTPSPPPTHLTKSPTSHCAKLHMSHPRMGRPALTGSGSMWGGTCLQPQGINTVYKPVCLLSCKHSCRATLSADPGSMLARMFEPTEGETAVLKIEKLSKNSTTPAVFVCFYTHVCTQYMYVCLCVCRLAECYRCQRSISDRPKPHLLRTAPELPQTWEINH